MSVYKVHTDEFGRLVACMQEAMYGITEFALQHMPNNLSNIGQGDIVFISERDVFRNALIGPFYVSNNREGLIFERRLGGWLEILPKKCSCKLPYWIEVENRHWCIIFDKTLSDKISIVWPYNWRDLNVNLPSWGIVTGKDAHTLIEYATANEQEAKDFFKRHGVW